MAGFTFKVTKDIDPKKFEAFRKRLEANKQIVKVGIPDNVTGEEGISLAMVGMVHEFGVPAKNIPERSFLRSGIKRNRQDFIRLNRINLVKILQGKMTIDIALGLLGEMAKAAVQKEIRIGKFKPLSERTIARKGSSKPLIDTGNMIQSITYSVEKAQK